MTRATEDEFSGAAGLLSASLAFYSSCCALTFYGALLSHYDSAFRRVVDAHFPFIIKSGLWAEAAATVLMLGGFLAFGRSVLPVRTWRFAFFASLFVYFAVGAFFFLALLLPGPPPLPLQR